MKIIHLLSGGNKVLIIRYGAQINVKIVFISSTFKEPVAPSTQLNTTS